MAPQQRPRTKHIAVQKALWSSKISAHLAPKPVSIISMDTLDRPLLRPVLHQPRFSFDFEELNSEIYSMPAGKSLDIQTREPRRYYRLSIITELIIMGLTVIGIVISLSLLVHVRQSYLISRQNLNISFSQYCQNELVRRMDPDYIGLADFF